MLRSCRLVVGLVVAFVFSGLGAALAQQQVTPDVLKMLEDLKKTVEQNTQEIKDLKKNLAEKDKVLSQKDEEINKLKATTSDLGQKMTRVDTVEKNVQTYLKDAEAKKEKPLRENEFGVLVGGMSGPYGTHNGAFFAGFMDMAWIPKDPLGNKISGELLAMFGQTNHRYGITDLGGETALHNQEIDTLAVIVGPKYTIVNKYLGPIRPYFVTGLGMYVYGQEMSNRYVMGQIPASPELQAHHSPAGNADLQFGVNIGGGIEWRICDILSIGWDMRHNMVTGDETDYTTVGGYLSLNF